MARHHYETLQQVSDDAYRGLAAQGFERSMRTSSGDPVCAYRGKDGLRCAIGHCIPDDAYHPDMEGDNASDVLPWGGAISRRAINQLQRAHDNSVTPDEMKAELADFASEFGLTIPSIEGAA